MSAATNGRHAPALELRGITAGYGRTTVLRDVDLTVQPGTIAALLGPNGAGKTTLLRAASGLLRAAARGGVASRARDVTSAAPRARLRAGLCLIPEGRGVFPNLTVRENLAAAGAAVGAQGRRSTARSTRSRRCASASASAPARLSGGQQQMLALARCFLATPSVVLLDEVSMGLAPRVIDEIFDALRRLAADGVDAAHRRAVRRAGRCELADAVYLLDRGRLTYSGRPDDLDEDDRPAGLSRHNGAMTG